MGEARESRRDHGNAAFLHCPSPPGFNRPRERELHFRRGDNRPLKHSLSSITQPGAFRVETLSENLREMGKEVMEHYTETKAVAARL